MQSDAWRGFRWLVPRRYGLANICGFLARGFGVSCECKSLWHKGEQVSVMLVFTARWLVLACDVRFVGSWPIGSNGARLAATFINTCTQDRFRYYFQNIPEF